MGRRIFVVAGEVSGDHQAARLIGELRRARPDLEIVGAGGGRMAATGARVLVDTTAWGLIGYAEAYIRLPVFALRYLRLVRLIERARPDLLLLVDFPGMNRELVRRFSGRRPIVYYVPPQTYARRGRSAARMARAAVRLLAVLPFEADAYRRAGADVVYVGHPAADEAVRRPAADEAVRRPAGGPGDAGASPLVALLPGSRTQEIRALLPPMLAAARDLAARRAARFVLPLASPHLRAGVGAAIAVSGVPVRVVDGRAVETMGTADVAVLASGTAAVEAACAGVPMVVVYRVSALTAWIARRFVITGDLDRTGFSIPNIVLGRRAVPELLQTSVTGPAIAGEVERLLEPAEAARARADLAEVCRRLGPPGAIGRAAAEVLTALDSGARATIR
ncbi:MAG TPA: lipid-A-disaccharide synthase [bacterium]|nr:lipid-A-disaccharide synthase [bacterium]